MRDDRAHDNASFFFEHAESYIWRGFQRIEIFLSCARVASRASRRSAFERVPSAHSRPSAAPPKGAAFRAAQADLRESARTFSVAADADRDRRGGASGGVDAFARTRRRRTRAAPIAGARAGAHLARGRSRSSRRTHANAENKGFSTERRIVARARRQPRPPTRRARERIATTPTRPNRPARDRLGRSTAPHRRVGPASMAARGHAAAKPTRAR
ncbi:hypothetical protein [Lysobacter sp. Root604]|uniref:hypothetical protein n=1 Tax=Lysobacter sp. Root604 TaxID=1736568 RepID=UPI0007004A9C|nr:hypothetical protein [Lysobacter sp. Root604]KRA17942.1 hypothetical protein ASD69_14970 [Lysobacter sp. Root604]